MKRYLNVNYYVTLEDRGKDESGAILIFVALLLSVIFACLLFAIDISRVTHASSGKQNVADHLALAALERYLSYEPTDTEVGNLPQGSPARNKAEHKVKFEQAFQRAWQMGANNYSIFRAANDAQGLQIRNSSDLAKGSVPPPRNKRGGIVAGRWWSRKPDTCVLTDAQHNPVCPCTINNSDPTPKACFQPCDTNNGCLNPDGTDNPPFANSIRIGLQNEEDAGISLYFASLFGASQLAVNADAFAGANGGTAAAAPKLGVFVIDLGRTMNIEDGFLPFESNPPAPNVKEASYQITGGTPQCDGTVNPFPCPGCYIMNAPSPEDGSEGNYGTVSPADYKCFTVPNGETHLVNMVETPQPLGELMVSAHNMLGYLKANSNPADRVALLGIDHQFITDRFIDFSDTNNPDFDKMFNVTDPNRRDVAARQFFFPRTGAKSDLPFALLTAYKKLKEKAPLYKVDPYIVLFTNGLTEGERVSDPQNPKYGRYPLLGEAGTDSLYDFHFKSLGEVVNVVEPTILDPDQVKVHVVMAGSKISPHGVLMRSSNEPSRCMTEDEIRTGGFLGVISETVNTKNRINYLALGSSITQPYIQPPTFLYSLAAMSQGSFTFLRPSCSSPAFGGSFSAATAGKYSSPDELCRMKGNVLPQIASAEGGALATNMKAVRDPTVPPTTLDGSGRLFCNPFQDSELTQSTKFIENVMEKRSVFLVTQPLR